MFKAVGLGGVEKDYPAFDFTNVFRRAYGLGLKLTAHCGETGNAESIKDSILYLNLDRVDHACSMYKDPQLAEYIRYRSIPVTCCPVSNIKIGIFKKMKNHPIKKYLDFGIIASINSDDPSYFGASLVDNYMEVIEAFDLSDGDILKLVLNSFKGSFLPASTKEYWKQRVLEKYKLYTSR